MCEDRHSESTAEDGVASTRAHPPSASGRGSRATSPDPVASDPTASTGRHIARSPLVSHTESLIDMQIPRASPSPHTKSKRSLDELFVDTTPPSPDKLQRELDRQHEEARRASASLLQPDARRTQAQERKRRKKLVYRGKPTEHGAQPPHSDEKNGHNCDEEGATSSNDDGGGGGGHAHARERPLSSPATSSED
ncbi:hypothetical protein LX32DRAFT_654585 [Colletotrichum zoysiae]|uniref:Uncharacterized protein n=1 Tax=Colletotrichum zoysiae TaxID=1216348 RepID=A0AAD9M286_9PEZI|nr:hypothetical protein LX32DRAFT_654585 [Colletotrichum zoysiae]